MVGPIGGPTVINQSRLETVGVGPRFFPEETDDPHMMCRKSDEENQILLSMVRKIKSDILHIGFVFSSPARKTVYNAF